VAGDVDYPPAGVDSLADQIPGLPAVGPIVSIEYLPPHFGRRLAGGWGV